MIHIYVKGYNYTKSNGVAVIVNNMLKYCAMSNVDIDCVGSLKDVAPSDVVIPYGPKESKELIDCGCCTKYSLLVDAISLGYLNKIKHYLKVNHVFHKDLLYCIYGYLRYSFYERQIIKKYQKIILVSQTDIDYLRKKNRDADFICLRNGVNFPQKITKKTSSDKIRVGILSMWDCYQGNEENRWILKKYIPEYVRSHPNVEFILAGKGGKIHEYSTIPGVRIVGEVEQLDDFFSNIDVLLSPITKGCGILNRILDAIAYKTPIIGHKNSFSGFKGMEKGFLAFDTYESFCKAMDEISDLEVRTSLVHEANVFAVENLNWEKNYIDFITKYFKSFKC